MNFKIKVTMAEQQILGYNAAKNGDTFIELIESMGLTRHEFEAINCHYGTLTESQSAELREYFDTKEAM